MTKITVSDEVRAALARLEPRQRKVLRALPEHEFQLWRVLRVLNISKALGHRWIRDPKFIEARRLVEQGALDEYGITTQRVMRELAAIAYADVRDLYDASGNLKPVHTLDETTAASIAAIEVEETTAGETVTTTRKIRRHDKLKALELAGRYMRIWGDEAVKPTVPEGPGLTVIVQTAGATTAVTAEQGTQGQVVVNLPGPE